MESPKSRRQRQEAARKAADKTKLENLSIKNNKLSIKLNKKVANLWYELDHGITPSYIAITKETNTAYSYHKKAIQELQSLRTGHKMAGYVTFFIVLVASVMDAFLWKSAFTGMDGIDSRAITNGIGMVVAIFGAVACTVLGRSIKQKSTYEEAMREDISGSCQYDKFTPFQKEVFDKNTTHDMLKLSIFTLALCSIIIPVVRWTTLNNSSELNSPINATDKVQAVGILSAVSYFIFAAVILLEMYNHCTWSKELRNLEVDYTSKAASHKLMRKRAIRLGKKLTNLDLSQKDKFNNFMSNEHFQLLNNDDNNDVYILPKPNFNKKQEKDSLDEQE